MRSFGCFLVVFLSFLALTLAFECEGNEGTVFENHRKKSHSKREASYVYILSGQRLIKNAKNGPFW